MSILPQWGQPWARLPSLGMRGGGGPGWSWNSGGALCALGLKVTWGCANLPRQQEPSGEKEPSRRVLLPGRLWFGFVKVGSCLYSVPGHLCSTSRSDARKVAEMPGLAYSRGGACVSPSHVTMGKSLESLSVPQKSPTGAGRDLSALRGWTCGFICLGLRSLSCSRFPGLCFGGHAGRAGAWWCAVPAGGKAGDMEGGGAGRDVWVRGRKGWAKEERKRVKL